MGKDLYIVRKEYLDGRVCTCGNIYLNTGASYADVDIACDWHGLYGKDAAWSEFWEDCARRAKKIIKENNL